MSQTPTREQLPNDEASRGLVTACAALGLGVLLLSVGCGGDPRISIQGTVTVDGQPVETGAITFLPADGVGQSAGAVIEMGDYSLPLPPGKKIVRIEGFRVVGQQHALPGDTSSQLVPTLEAIVPAKYNSQSTLSIDVPDRVSRTPHGGTFDFALQP